MPRAYTACRSGCALLPSVHVELKKRKIIKKEEVEKVSMKQLLKNTISSKKVLLPFSYGFSMFSKHFKLNLRSKHRL